MAYASSRQLWLTCQPDLSLASFSQDTFVYKRRTYQAYGPSATDARDRNERVLFYTFILNL